MMISPVGSMLGYVDVAAGRQGAVLATLRRPLGSENEYPSDARPSGKPSYRSPEQTGWYGALFSRALPPGFHPTSIGARPGFTRQSRLRRRSQRSSTLGLQKNGIESRSAAIRQLLTDARERCCPASAAKQKDAR